MTIRALAIAFAISLFAPMAMAAPNLEQIIVQLKSQGYDDIEVERTWLGRIRIEAENERHEREIIINPRTGEILRDFSYVEDDDDDFKGLLSHD